MEKMIEVDLSVSECDELIDQLRSTCYNKLCSDLVEILEASKEDYKISIC